MKKMKNFYGKKVGYKLDWLTLPIRFQTEEDRLKYGHFDLEKELVDRGFPVRGLTEADKVVIFDGYNSEDAKIIELGVNDRGPMEYTLLTKQEYRTIVNEDGEEIKEPTYKSGLISLGGNALAELGFQRVINLLHSLSDISYATRIDVACDIAYRRQEETKLASREFAEAAGWTIDYEEKDIQNPNNRLAPGRLNKKSPIEVSEQSKSNASTTYIGGRKSLFRIRAYDKRAEVQKRTNGEVDPGPIFRVEAVGRKYIGEAARKMLLLSVSKGYGEQEILKRLWHNLANDRISIRKEVGSVEVEKLGEFLGVGSATKLNLDYTEIEGDVLEYNSWVQTMVSPKFNRLSKEKNLTPKEIATNWLRLAMVNDMEKETKDYFNKLIGNLPEN